MVRKAVFQKEDIVAAGLQVVTKEGLGQLSARRVGEELGASTAPVYSNFANMDELEKAVKDAAVELLLERVSGQPTENRFLNMGIGVLSFAQDYPQLYTACFHSAPGAYDPGPQVLNCMLEMMATIKELAHLSRVDRVLLLKKMAIFTHGMAIEIASGRGDQVDLEILTILLDEVGTAVLKDAQERPPRNLEEVRRLGALCEIGEGNCLGIEKQAKNGEDND